MTDRQTTHGYDCWAWGPKHYECAVREIGRLAARLTAAQPAISGYTCTVPDDCETLHWRGQILSMNELASVAQPAEGEEIIVNTPYDVFILPLRPSWLSSGPRFVVHVPGPEAQAQDGGEAEPPNAPVGVDFAAVASILRRAMRDGAHYGYRREFILQQALALESLSQQPAAVVVDEAMVERACRHWYAQWDKADQATQRVWAKTMYDLLTAALATKHQGDRR